MVDTWLVTRHQLVKALREGNVQDVVEISNRYFAFVLACCLIFQCGAMVTPGWGIRGEWGMRAGEGKAEGCEVFLKS